MSLTHRSLRQYLTFAQETAYGAAQMLQKGFQTRMRVDFKGRIDPVTEYDLKSEKYITTRIQKTFPDHTILTEEGTNRKEVSPFRWIVDPLDGTVNYAHGFPIYCVSIALEFLGEIVVGAVYDPESREMYSASAGLGAKLNGRHIQVSSENKLERSLIATGFAYDVATAKRNNLGLFGRMVKTAQAVRRPGSAALDLCWLACGRFDGFWELFLHPWDTAAAVLIVTEAGGRATRVSGTVYSVFDDDLLASNGRIHGAMKKVLNRRK